MKPKYKTFEYFSSSLLDPLYSVYRVLDDKAHKLNGSLADDLNSISPEELDRYFEENNMDHYVRSIQNRDLERRAFFYVKELWKLIPELRIHELLSEEERPKPYNSPNLGNLVLDKNKLVNILDFEFENLGLKKGSKIYNLCPMLYASNSNHWIQQALIENAKLYDMFIRIRLDPLIEISQENYCPMHYRMHVYGKPLDWKSIKSLKTDLFGQWFNEKDYVRHGFTDYVWSPKNNEINFTVEELPKYSNEELRISRYFHAIFDKSSGSFSHCDGGIRLFNPEEYQYRIKYHIKDPEVRKIGVRIKIFQFDSCNNSNELLNHNIFTEFVTNYFVWNDDLLKYFN